MASRDLERELRFHFDVILKCKQEAELGVAVLATPPGLRYPYAYPRDMAATAKALRLMATKTGFGDEAFGLLEGMAEFTLYVQRPDGYWGHRYHLSGEERSLYRQEDNVAHGIIILMSYLLAAKEREETPKHLDQIRESVFKASGFAIRKYYRQEINLFFSTTSIHESALEKGYSIWVNFAYLKAHKLMLEYFGQDGHDLRVNKTKRFLRRFEPSAYSIFIGEGRYLRRFTPRGQVDLRPDITLLSPFYFGFGDIHSQEMHNSVVMIERDLWDPELGGLQRYLPFTEDLNTHIHAGNGPWLLYTAMLAQYYYYKGDVERGDEIVSLIDQYRGEDGYIPEHLSTYECFDEFMRLEWNTGLDFKKEFNPEILLPNVPFSYIIDELNHMRRTYDEIARLCSENGGVGYIKFATPLNWSHVEYALALMERGRVRRGEGLPRRGENPGWRRNST